MKPFYLRILALIVVVLASFAGDSLGGWYAKAEASGTFQPWELLGTPPDTAVKILAADHVGVIVETQAEKIYRCLDTRAREKCQEVTDSSWRERAPVSNCSYTPYQAGSPPVNTIDQAEVATCSGELTVQNNYAVGDDGSVWMWEFGGGAFFGFGSAFLYPLFGCGIGLVFSLIVMMRICDLNNMRRRRLEDDSGRLQERS